MKAIVTLFRPLHLIKVSGLARRGGLNLFTESAGGLMVEAVVAVSLMTVVGTAVLSGLSTTHISGAVVERQSIGENIARNQMAHVFSEPYNTTLGDNAYTAYSTSLESGYSIGTRSEGDPNDPLNTDLQIVIVSVAFEGEQIFKLESIKSQ